MRFIRDWSRQFRLEHGLGFTREECQLYEFPHGGKDKKLLNYLSIRHTREIFWPAVRLNSQWRFLADKWVSGLFFSAAGIPVPRTYGFLHPEYGVTAAGMPLRGAQDFANLIQTEKPRSLIIKPRSGGGGHFVFRFDPVFENGDLLLKTDGQLIGINEACEKIPLRAACNHYHGWIVQERVVQHPDLEKLNADTLNTFRIVSFLTKRGEFRLHGAILKVGVPGAHVDNWHVGGLCIGIDCEKGVLLGGIKHGCSRFRQLEVHPDSGVRFTGMPIPCWTELLETVRRASMSLSGVKSIGWDVAVGKDGPVIIEANAGWHLPLVQVQSEGYLTKEVRRDLKSYGVVFPKRFPSFGTSLWRRIKHALKKRAEPDN